ncbi:MAG: hypothetical protein ACXVPD_04205 [Bacteroidia bacterium]
MILRVKHLFLILFVAVLAAECKKKSDPAPDTTTPPTQTGSSNINDVFTNNGSQPQTLQVSGTSAQTVTVNGVKVEIPANAFVTLSNGAVTGTVNLTIKTILTKSEIILSGAGANSSSSRLVQTKGCVKVTASQNNQSLRMSSSSVGSMFVNVPSATSTITPLRKYYTAKVTASDSTMLWKIGTDTTNIPVVFDGVNYQNRAALDSLKWLNVGSQWDTTGAKTTVKVSVGSQFNKSNTAVYISLNGSLTVGALYEGSPNLFHIANMPVGKGVNIVGIAIINGQYYSAVLPANVSGTTLNLNLQAVTLGQIQSQLSALP